MNNEFKPITTNLIIGFDQSSEEHAVLIVGHQKNGKVSIVNAFENEEAKNIYTMLTKTKLPVFDNLNKFYKQLTKTAHPMSDKE